jgi:hypothetical protein
MIPVFERAKIFHTLDLRDYCDQLKDHQNVISNLVPFHSVALSRFQLKFFIHVWDVSSYSSFLILEYQTSLVGTFILVLIQSRSRLSTLSSLTKLIVLETFHVHRQTCFQFSMDD